MARYPGAGADRGGGAIDPALASTCAAVATALADGRDPWWIIASAAVALHGYDPGPIGDVDVLTSVGDARRICAALGIAFVVGEATDRFRSTIFARWDGAALPVEIMAGFEVAATDGWQAIRPATRLAVPTPGGPVYIPERGELAAIIRSFGRPKDVARAALLD